MLVAGLVGAPVRRREARAWFERADLAKHPVQFIEADTGFEEVTLRAVRAWAARADPGTPVLYAHTKGSYNISALTAEHREIMTKAVVGRWHAAIAALEAHDAAGCFWDGHIFTGNFWWAKAGYLAGLPDVPCANRYECENWVGLGTPVIWEMADTSYTGMAELILGRPETEVPPGTVLPPGSSVLGKAVTGPTIPFGWAGRQ